MNTRSISILIIFLSFSLITNSETTESKLDKNSFDFVHKRFLDEGEYLGAKPVPIGKQKIVDEEEAATESEKPGESESSSATDKPPETKTPPETEKPESDNPESDKPESDKPESENPEIESSSTLDDSDETESNKPGTPESSGTSSLEPTSPSATEKPTNPPETLPPVPTFTPPPVPTVPDKIPPAVDATSNYEFGITMESMEFDVTFPEGVTAPDDTQTKEILADAVRESMLIQLTNTTEFKNVTKNQIKVTVTESAKVPNRLLTASSYVIDVKIVVPSTEVSADSLKKANDKITALAKNDSVSTILKDTVALAKTRSNANVTAPLVINDAKPQTPEKITVSLIIEVCETSETVESGPSSPSENPLDTGIIAAIQKVFGKDVATDVKVDKTVTLKDVNFVHASFSIASDKNEDVEIINKNLKDRQSQTSKDFYQELSGKSGGVYEQCDTPTLPPTLPPGTQKTDCAVTPSNVVVVKNTAGSISIDDYYSTYHYSLSCSKQNVFSFKENKEITFGWAVTDPVICWLTCQSTDFLPNQVSFSFEVLVEDVPEIVPLNSTIPSKIIPGVEFNVTIALVSKVYGYKWPGEDTVNISLPHTLTNDKYELVYQVQDDDIITANITNNTAIDLPIDVIQLKFEIKESIYLPKVTVFFPGICPVETDDEGICCKREGDALCQKMRLQFNFLRGDDFESFTGVFIGEVETIFLDSRYEPIRKVDAEYPDSIVFHIVTHSKEYHYQRSLLDDNPFTNMQEIISKFVDDLKNNKIHNLLGYATKINPLSIYSFEQLPVIDSVDGYPTKPSDNTKSWAEENWYVILIIVIIILLLIAVIIGLVFYMKKRQPSSPTKHRETEMDSVVPIGGAKEEIKENEPEKEVYQPYNHEIIMEGYLLKEGHDRVVDKYQKRYCVLYYDPPTLRIYESMMPSFYGSVYVGEKQSIPLICLSKVELAENQSDFAVFFNIRDSKLKTFEPGETEKIYRFRVEGENCIDIAQKWMDAFTNYQDKKPIVTDAWKQSITKDEDSGKYIQDTPKSVEQRNEDIVNRVQTRRKQGQKLDQIIRDEPL